MHAGQLDITRNLVARLVDSQFPALAGRPVTAVRSDGTVNALFRVGDDLVARLPIESGHPGAQRARIEAEAAAARRLLEVSPYPTPEPVAIGDPGQGYPLPWALYRWIPGTIASRAAIADSADFAEDVAQFVSLLRSLPTGGRSFTGSGRGGVLTAHDESVEFGLAQIRSIMDVDALARLWADLRMTPRSGPDAWTHGDLMPGNLLADEGRLAGVIDVGDFSVADPALDLQPAWNLMGQRARAAFRSALGTNDNEWHRGKGWAFAQAIGCLWYYRETNPVMSVTAQTTMEALLADA
ncbi:MAG: aminoglycoside phosphotransferase family protein [Nocardioidaceae bacterium]